MKKKGYLRILFLLSCSTSALAWQGKIDDELVLREGLPNFCRKIARGDSIRVGYFGGSITAQPGWRVQSLEWFRERFPKGKFREIHAAIGGTGSDFGAFRLNEHVLRHNPDLVFVEFAVNNHRFPDDKTIRSMESIVRQIWTRNPETDICFIYTTIEGFLTEEQRGNLPGSAIAMEEVADHYGIPAINFGKEVYRLKSSGDLIITGKEHEQDGKQVFSRDGVHPYPETGHVIYSTVLKRCFEEIAKHTKTKRAKHKLSTRLSDVYSSPRMVTFSAGTLSKTWEIIDAGKDALFSRFSNRLETVGKAVPGESLSFRFKGKAFGAYDFMGPGTGRLLIRIDGVVKDTVSRFDSFCTYMRMNYFIID